MKFQRLNLGCPANEQPTHNEPRKQNNHQTCADDTQFFSNDREQEVRVCFGQEKQLLDAVAKPKTYPFTPTECNQRLRLLVTAAKLVFPRIRERRQSRQTIGFECHNQRHNGDAKGHQRQEESNRNAGQEDHADRCRYNYDGRTEVRLAQQQQHDRCQHEQRLCETTH